MEKPLCPIGAYILGFRNPGLLIFSGKMEKRVFLPSMVSRHWMKLCSNSFLDEISG